MAPRRAPLPILGIIAFSGLLVPSELDAQLRPLDPLDLTAFGRGSDLIVESGIGVYERQRASLAGLEGRLLELGTIRLLWRWDRVIFDAAGTVRRRFDGRRAFAEPVPGVEGSPGHVREDVGAFRLATIVALARTDAMNAVLRFGTRLPTTDDVVGLDRDRTDFFASVGGSYAFGAWLATAESGVGILGTRGSAFDQVDVWLYSATVEYDSGAWVPGITLVGQADGLRGQSVRGNEDLRELRFGFRAGTRRWVRLAAVRGLTEFSPSYGVSISLGASF